MIGELLPFVDVILIMTVNPGDGGQSMIPECLEKGKELAKTRKKRGFSYEISVDGGINRSTIDSAAKAGIDVFVAGSAFFGADDPRSELEFLKNR